MKLLTGLFNVKDAGVSFFRFGRWDEFNRGCEQEGDYSLKAGLITWGKVGWGILFLGAASLCSASDVHTNPLNRDPLVREGYDHFYNLDFPVAIDRFSGFTRLIRAIRRGLCCCSRR